MNAKRIFLPPVAILVAAMAFNIGCKKTETVTEPVKQYVQVERMGIPAINTALIPAASKDAFNQGDPKNDVANFLSTAQNTITALRAAVNGVSGFPPEDTGSANVPASVLASILIPDVVTIDFTKPVQFTNGRRLEDDVIDVALGLVLNRGRILAGGPGISDGITASSPTPKRFLSVSTFPYLGEPYVPLAKSGGN